MLVNLVFRPFYRKSNSSVLLPPEVLICFSSVKSSSSTLIRCFDQMFFSSIPYWSATKIPIPGKFLHSSRFHFFLSFVASLFGSSQATLLPSIFAVFLSQCVYFTRPWFFSEVVLRECNELILQLEKHTTNAINTFPRFLFVFRIYCRGLGRF